MDWFLYDRDIRNERVNSFLYSLAIAKGSHPAFTYSKSKMETPKHCVKSVQS